MPYSKAEKYTLEFWSFLNDHRSDPSIWGGLLWDVRQAIVDGIDMQGFTPDEDEMGRILGEIISHSKLFYAMCEKKPSLPPAIYETMAGIFARFVVHYHWHELGD